MRDLTDLLKVMVDEDHKPNRAERRALQRHIRRHARKSTRFWRKTWRGVHSQIEVARMVYGGAHKVRRMRKDDE